MHGPAGPHLSPRLIDLPDRRIAVVETRGDPALVSGPALRALFISVRALLGQGALPPPPSPIRARWPNVDSAPKEEWITRWALPVPDDTRTLPQPDPAVVVSLETWRYGRVAEIVHVGPFDHEAATVDRLRRFIADRGLAPIGAQEEEYLTLPGSTEQRTAIRFRVAELREGGRPIEREFHVP